MKIEFKEGGILKVTFYSNYLNHHQIPFSNEMYKLLGKNYVFVSTEPMSKERKDMGWSVNSEYPYELRAYENNESAKSITIGN